jgi:uncharacterized protein YjbI with pentapeptide repeats
MNVILPKKPTRSFTEPFADKLQPELRIENAHIELLDAIGIHAENMSIDESILERVQFVQAKLEKLGLSDVRLQGCDLSAAKCADGSWLRVHVKGGRLVGIDLSNTTLKDIIFEDCKLDLANFRSSKLTRVQFIGCHLQETDFQMATLTNVAFTSSELKKVAFSRATLNRVDARTSQLFDIRGWDSLKGLTLDASQLMAIAPELANELGLLIED